VDDRIGVNLVERERTTLINQRSLIPRLQLRVQSLAYVIARLPLRYKVRYLFEKISGLFNRRARQERHDAEQREIERQDQLTPATLLKVKQSTNRALQTYDPKPYTGPLTFIRAGDE